MYAFDNRALLNNTKTKNNEFTKLKLRSYHTFFPADSRVKRNIITAIKAIFIKAIATQNTGLEVRGISLVDSNGNSI